MTMITIDSKDLNDARMKTNDVLLFSYIKTFANNQDIFAIKITRIEEDLNLSKQSIKSSLKVLFEKQLLSEAEIRENGFLLAKINNAKEIVFEKKEDKKQQKEYSQEVKNVAEEVINYLNQRVNKKMRPKTSYDIISARMNSNDATIDDFKKVIDNMVELWGRDQKMSQYLTPGTLFAKKHFDDYLNKIVTRKERRNINKNQNSKEKVSNQKLFD